MKRRAKAAFALIVTYLVCLVPANDVLGQDDDLTPSEFLVVLGESWSEELGP